MVKRSDDVRGLNPRCGRGTAVWASGHRHFDFEPVTLLSLYAIGDPCGRRRQGWVLAFPRYSRDRILTKAVLDSITSSMNAISYTAARENLASTMDRVCNDHTPVIITRNRDQSVVMLSLEDFESLEETAYLIRSPANAKRLLEAIRALEIGKGVVRDIDLDS